MFSAVHFVLRSVARTGSARHVALLLSFLPLLGCSSLRKQADEQFEKGAYEEALRLYDLAVTQDPSDAEASAGQRKARLKLIDTRLLTVRYTRLGGNVEGALALLRQVVADEIRWKAFPQSAVSSTQDEETQALFPYFRSQVQNALKRNQPLRAQYWLEHHRPVFAGSHGATLSTLATKTAQSGRALCGRLEASAQSSVPYFAQFLSKACGLWGADTEALRAAVLGKNADLYRKVDATVRLRGGDHGAALRFAAAVEAAFRESPWFDGGGRRTHALRFAGSYSRRYAAREETRAHSYMVQIPYTHYETVTRTVRVPRASSYASTGSGLSDAGSSYRSSDTETVSYRDTVPVTRYRSEPRVQEYDGIYESQVLSLAIEGVARFGSAERTVTLSERSRTAGFRHDWSMPSIGLAPEGSKLEDPDAWLSAQATALGQKLLEESDDAWNRLYCRPLADGATFAMQGNQVHRCLRRRPETFPAFVTAWYTNHFAITPEQATELFSLNDF